MRFMEIYFEEEAWIATRIGDMAVSEKILYPTSRHSVFKCQ